MANYDDRANILIIGGGLAGLFTALKLALSMIDLTTLEGADSPGKVRQMCYKAAHLADNVPDVPHVGAVCVYPTLVRIAKDALKGTGINVAAVATGLVRSPR